MNLKEGNVKIGLILFGGVPIIEMTFSYINRFGTSYFFEKNNIIS